METAVRLRSEETGEPAMPILLTVPIYLWCRKYIYCNDQRMQLMRKTGSTQHSLRSGELNKRPVRCDGEGSKILRNTVEGEPELFLDRIGCKFE